MQWCCLFVSFLKIKISFSGSHNKVNKLCICTSDDAAVTKKTLYIYIYNYKYIINTYYKVSVFVFLKVRDMKHFVERK